MLNKKVVAIFLAVTFIFLFLLQQQWSSTGKKRAPKAKIIRPLKQKQPRLFLVKQGQQKQKRAQLEVNAKPPAFLRELFPKANLTKALTEQQGQAQLTTVDFTVNSSLAELEDSLINKFSSNDWVLLRESSQPEIGFNLIFSQLETEKTVAFFAVKEEVKLKEVTKPLVRVSVLYAEKIK